MMLAEHYEILTDTNSVKSFDSFFSNFRKTDILRDMKVS